MNRPKHVFYHWLFLLSPFCIDVLLVFATFKSGYIFHILLTIKYIYGVIYFLIASFLAFKLKNSGKKLFGRFKLKIAYGITGPLILGYGPLLALLTKYAGVSAGQFFNFLIALLLADFLFYMLIGLYTLKDLIFGRSLDT